MNKRLLNFFIWSRQKSIFRIFEQTFIMLMPIALVGSFFKMLRDVVFAPESLIYNVANFDIVMSDKVWNIGADVCFGMVRVTIGVLGIYAAYFTARYTAKMYNRDATIAGTASVVVILFCAYFASLNNGARSVFFSGVLHGNGILIALIIGYCVGQIFHFLSPKKVSFGNEKIAVIRQRALASIKPLLATILLGLVAGVAIYLLKFKMLNSNTFKSLVVNLQSSNNIWEIIGIDLVCNLLSWIGIGYPRTSLTSAVNSGASNANLNFALRHGSSWNIPYKYLGSSLIQSYGSIMWLCFALILLTIFLKRKSYSVRIAQLNILPVTFNTDMGLMIGWPLVLNPLFLPSILFLPVLNILLASLAIALRLIPAPAYPVLAGTPQVLVPFFSSNGNWQCLLFSFFLLAIDILLLFPCVKINAIAEAKIKEGKAN